MPVTSSSASAYGAFLAQRHQKHRVILAHSVIHPLLQGCLLRRNQLVVSKYVVDFHVLTLSNLGVTKSQARRAFRLGNHFDIDLAAACISAAHGSDNAIRRDLTRISMSVNVGSMQLRPQPVTLQPLCVSKNVRMAPRMR